MTDDQGGNVLEIDGYDINITHFRLSPRQRDEWVKIGREDAVNKILLFAQTVSTLRPKHAISPHGGWTLAQVFKGDELVAEAVAVCSPRDNYCKRIGRDIATGRALKELRT
jgi:hypothetical protein